MGSEPTGVPQTWWSYSGSFRTNVRSSTKDYVAFLDLTKAFDSEQKETVEDNRVPWLCSYAPQHGYPNCTKTRRLHAHTKLLEYLFRELLFADDTAFVVHIERALQHLTSFFEEAAQHFGIDVSLKKTDVLEKYRPPHIIGGTELKAVYLFTYLGCTITSDLNIDGEVDDRLA